MVNFLRKHFIKDFENTSNPVVRTKHGYLANIVGMISNLLLFSFKIIIGILIFSMSIISDAINNLTDMASCIVNLFGFKLASKPADKEHPFGHERIEYIAGLIVSFVIIVIAVIAGYSSVMKIINNSTTSYNNNLSTIFTFVILVAAILVKLWQSFFYKKIAICIDSISLKANSQDALNDVISTSAVLISTLVEFILYKNGIIVQIDGWMGIAVSLFIVVSGIKLVIESSNPLIGITPDNKLVKDVVDNILKTPGVLGVHDLMCHSYGPSKIFMTIHVEVDSRVDVMISHDLMDDIEVKINKDFGVLLTCHMDPIAISDPLTNELKDKTIALLKTYSEEIRFHDFRIVKGITHTNILFDVVLSFDSKIKEEDLLSHLKREFKKLDKNYNLVVKVDRDYLGN